MNNTIGVSISCMYTYNICSHYQVAVVYLPEKFEIAALDHPDVQFRKPNSVGPSTCQIPDQPYCYITAEFSARLLDDIPTHDDIGKQFIVGGGDPVHLNSPNDRTNLYSNDLLCSSGTYTFFVRAFTAENVICTYPVIYSITACYIIFCFIIVRSAADGTPSH